MSGHLLTELTVAEYMAAAASDQPTPGGGSVAAVAAALAASMAAMSARFTLGRKKYADVAEEVAGFVAVADAARGTFLKAVDDDAKAFAAVGAAYGLPKATDEEKAARRKAVAEASRGAVAAPLSVMRESLKVLSALPRLAAVGNVNLVSDTGVSAELFHAAVRSALLNVAVNLGGLDDIGEADRLRTEGEAALAAAADAVRAVRMELARRMPVFAGLV